MSKQSPTSSQRRRRREALIPAANAAASSDQPQPDANSSLNEGQNESAGAPPRKAVKPSLPILDLTDESEGIGFMLIGVNRTQSKRPTPKS
jgi:hypothetical protein